MSYISTAGSSIAHLRLMLRQLPRLDLQKFRVSLRRLPCFNLRFVSVLMTVASTMIFFLCGSRLFIDCFVVGPIDVSFRFGKNDNLAGILHTSFSAFVISSAALLCVVCVSIVLSFKIIYITLFRAGHWVIFAIIAPALFLLTAYLAILFGTNGPSSLALKACVPALTASQQVSVSSPWLLLDALGTIITSHPEAFKDATDNDREDYIRAMYCSLATIYPENAAFTFSTAISAWELLNTNTICGWGASLLSIVALATLICANTAPISVQWRIVHIRYCVILVAVMICLGALSLGEYFSIPTNLIDGSSHHDIALVRQIETSGIGWQLLNGTASLFIATILPTYWLRRDGGDYNFLELAFWVIIIVTLPLTGELAHFPV